MRCVHFTRDTHAHSLEWPVTINAKCALGAFATIRNAYHACTNGIRLLVAICRDCMWVSFEALYRCADLTSGQAGRRPYPRLSNSW